MIPSAQDFYVNSALYSEFKFQIENKKELFYLVHTKESVDCYCPECLNHSVFKADENRPRGQYGYLEHDSWEDFLKLMIMLSIKNLRVQRDSKHKLRFSILIFKDKFLKFGQFPSLADVALYDIKKYRKVLGDEYYNEFSKAIGLFAHGIGVGSFVYLRRIIENFIIKPAYENLKADEHWGEEKYQIARIKEIFEILKDELPDFLVNNAVIYSIVSKGIHELSEEECKSYFPVIRECIEFVLTELEANRQKEVKRKQLGMALSNINTKIK